MTTQAIQHEVWIKASKAEVFDAITSREGLNAWWGKALKAEPEHRGVVEFDHGLGQPLRMEITEITPGESVTWRCVSDYDEAGNPASEWLGHELRFELADAPDGPDSQWLRDRLELGAGDSVTVLRFTHAGWTGDARWFAFCNNGWGVALGALTSCCETTQD